MKTCLSFSRFVLSLLLLASPHLHAASDVTVSSAVTSGGSFAGTNPNVFTPTASPAVASTTTILTSLNGGNAVTINTASAAGGNGDLTVSNTLTKSAGASSTLTLNAVRDLSIPSVINSSSGAIPMVLNAGRNIGNTNSISSNGGNITLGATQVFTVGSNIDAGAGQISIPSGSVESTVGYTMTAASVQVSPGAALRLNSYITGNLTVGGTISPAAPSLTTGFTQVSGTVTLQGSSTTVIDLGGTSQGSTYDRIYAGGAVTVAGTLQVNLVNNFHDTIDKTHVFTIVQGSSVTGTFSGYPNGSRITLANDYGSLRVNYTANSVTLDDWKPVIVDLTWDAGTADAGTSVFSNTNTRAGRHYFRILTQATDIGAWRSRLTMISGDAALYLSKTNWPTVGSYQFSSVQTGSEGMVLRDDQFAAGEEWFLMVYANAGAQWNIFSGRAYVNDLGGLPYTDSNSNSQYDIGEAVSPQSAPAAAMPPEGIRFYKATVPAGTPAWSLWLNGSTRDLAIRTTKVPFHVSSTYYTRKQSGQMLVVPTVLGTGTNAYFISVAAPPGESIGLDSRIQTVQDIAFNSTTSNVAVAAAPYRVYRTQVPIDQIAWDVSTTANSGNPNVAVRKNNVPAEFDNEAFSEAPGSATDSVTLVPDYLTNGTWFITVWGTGAYNFTLKSGDPVVTPLSYTDFKTNDQPTRAGWRFYSLTDIPSQVGTLGWELLLSGQVPGTQIAIRRNKVPSRWQYRSDGSVYVADTTTTYMDYFGNGGFLQRPGHQADVWYVGIFLPQQPLGAFNLDTHPLVPATVGFDGSNTAVAALEPGRWKFQRVDVPAGATGWDVRAKNVTGTGIPYLVVRRDQLPQTTATTPWSYPYSSNTWPSGYSWMEGLDWTNRVYEAGGSNSQYYRRLVMGSGGPLEAGTYYVGVYNGDASNAISYTLESRGIGSGQTLPVTTLSYTAGSTATITNLAAREAAYYKVSIPANTPSWEFTLSPSAGEMMMCARFGTIPDFMADYDYASLQTTSYKEQVRVQKDGPERYVLLPLDNQDYLQAGDYYIAVVSEGTSPSDTSHIGTGTSSGVLTSLGALATTDLGAATPAGVTQPVSLAGGQLKSYSFTIPAGTASLEVRLDNRVGNPNMGLISGTRIATRYPAYGAYGYGYGGGQVSGTVATYDDNLITIANPPVGPYRVTVRADAVGSAYPNTSADLVVVANAPVPLTFDGGTSNVVNQAPTAWRYFQVTVPAGVQGWDVRMTNLTGGISPTLVVRRDQLPQSTNTSPWSYPYASNTWPTAYSWSEGLDWTNRYYEAGGSTYTGGRRLVMGSGAPLEPGTYYVGVYNGDASLPMSYTVESRGIGSGQTIPIGTLAYTAGSTATITNLAPREAVYYKVSIPAATPSWEFTLAPSVGEMMMCARFGTIPDFQADNESYSLQGSSYKEEVRMQKTGPERYVLLPLDNQDSLQAGDYYIAVVSEGVNPSDTAHIGTGTSSGVLTSLGALATTDLGAASAAGLTQPVSLEGGQLKSYAFTIPAGTASLEVRLDNRVGNPNMGLVSGTRVASRYPGYGTYGYGYGGGQISGTVATYDDNLITIANPPAGPYRLTVRADAVSSTYPNASADLVIIANAPSALTFDGGTSNVANQAPTAWRYFQVTVPAGALGWDVRLKNISGGATPPTLVVRRDQLPQNVNTGPWSYPYASNTWPTGYSWTEGPDWTNRYYEAGASTSTGGQRLVMGSGGPLEPGTYFVGVYNGDASTPANYTVDSRGIGSGLTYPVTTLAYTAGSSANITNLAPREAAYYKVSIPANTPSWEFTLSPSAGEMMMCARLGAIPDFWADTEYNNIQATTYKDEVRMQKAGPERYVLLPLDNQDFIQAGDYYIAVVGEGVNPSDTAHIGTGTSSGVLTSLGALATTDLGSATIAGLTQPVSLAGGQIKSYAFTVPAGTANLEVRLDNRVGNPNIGLVSGTRIASRYPGYGVNSYGYGGGQINGTVATYDDNLITISNPPAGPYRLNLRADPVSSNYPDASANLVVRQKPRLPLNFASSLNGNGLSNTDSRQLLDTEKSFYEVPVPTTVGGQPVVGWILRSNVLQGSATIRVYKTWGNPGTGIQVSSRTAVITPPFLTPGDTWYVEVQGNGLTNYTITSEPVTLERPVYTMPAGHNSLVGDSGNDASGSPLPGDRGVDLGQDDWHFFAVDVPEGNAGLLRTELQAINGNPNLYIREDGVPTTDHYSGGPGGNVLYHRSLTSTASEYGNWVPLDGRYQKQLRAGRWYFGVKATGGTNARYRLIISTGQVVDLSLGSGSVTNQTLVGRDWRYYRFTLPLDAPNTWNLTFSQQVGDVNMWLRDTIPPGNNLDGLEASDAYYGYPYGLRSWAWDTKNQGPYNAAGQDSAGSYAFNTGPLRPGHTYYVGFRAANDATFSFSSSTSGGTIGVLPLLDFYNGTINTSIPAGGSLLYRIPVLAEATRLKWAATNPASVELRLEQGTLPGTSGTQHWLSNGAVNAVFNQVLTTPNNWPWVPNQSYYLRLSNSSGSPQNVTLTMAGKNAATDDEDNDGLPDAWELTYFGNYYSYDGNGDPDFDGVTNAVEFADGTIPNNTASAKYSLSFSQWGGTAAKSPVQAKYDRGTVVNLTDTPTAGYTFLGWQRVGNYADDFAVKITGSITISTPGTYTFGMNTSDGARLKINGTDVIVKDIYYAPSDDFGQITLPAGTYPLELTAFDYFAGEALELFAAAGTHTSFNGNFKLVGDTASGGLAASAFTVLQVAAVSPNTIYNLALMDELLAGTRSRKAEATATAATINYFGGIAFEGHFLNNAKFPLQQPIATNPLGMAMYGDYTVAALNTIPLPTALDAPALTFVTGGDMPWLGENSALAFDNVDQAGSGPITHSQSSSLSTTVTGPGTFSFRWRVSSEVNGDFLQFLVDSDVNQQISGEQSYPQVNYSVPAGTHTLIWRYIKSASISSGSDRGWVDAVTWAPTGTPFSNWQAANFTGPGQLADPLISGANADPDKDGIINMMEFAFNLPPLVPDVHTVTPGSGSSGLPSITRIVVAGGQSRLRFEYLRRTDGSLTYTPQASDAMSVGPPGPWGVLSGVPVITPVVAGWERVVVEDVSGTGHPFRFGRLVVTMP